ncbi:hypothetical protein FACS1894211_12900 [Clostridia bacterium]|nr:hypothetical protein FACS1894211_12900 [Clostridia bacterium]
MEINSLILSRERDYSNARTAPTEFMLRHDSLLSHENGIKKLLRSIQTDFLMIAYRLIEIRNQRLFDTVYYGDDKYCADICQYAYRALGFSKSTTYNLLKVAETFSDDFRGLKKKYQDYGLSQLIELMSVPAHLHGYFDPVMTVKEMRELKAGKRLYIHLGKYDGGAYSGNDCLRQIPADEIHKWLGNMKPGQKFFQTSGKAEQSSPAVLAGQITISDAVICPDVRKNEIEVSAPVIGSNVEAEPENCSEDSAIQTGKCKISVPTVLLDPLFGVDGYDIPISDLLEMASKILLRMEANGEYNAAVYGFYNRLRSDICRYVIAFKDRAEKAM